MNSIESSSADQKHEVPRDFSGAVALVKSLIETRTFRKEKLELNAIKVALDLIGETIASPSGSFERLEGVSILGKAAEVSVPISKEVGPILQNVLELELPQTGEWGNANDRKYLAKGIEFSTAHWIGRYAAVELARSDIAEKLARDAWAGLAMGHAENLADLLREIARALTEQLSQYGNPADLTYRKLMRISEALATSLPTADLPPGDGFGKAFSLLVRPAGGSKGTETKRLREEAAIKVLDFLLQILRLRFESIYDPDFYRAVGAIRGWWSPARPPKEVEQIADRIAVLAVRGLHFWARQGIKSKAVRLAMVGGLGAARVNTIAGGVVSADPSLTPEISNWLATGQELPEIQSNDSVKAINEHNLDELLARLLLAINNQDGGARALTVAAQIIEAFEPTQAATLRASAGRLELIEQWAAAIGRMRNLEVQGLAGEVVQYDPAIHDIASVAQLGLPVRIVTPSVVKVADRRASIIIVKAIVEEK